MLRIATPLPRRFGMVLQAGNSSATHAGKYPLNSKHWDCASLTVACTHATNASQSPERIYSRETDTSPTPGSIFIKPDQHPVGQYTSSNDYRPTCLDFEWPSEKNMVAAAVNQLRATSSGDSLVLEEFRTSFGLPDILHVCFDARKLTARMVTHPRARTSITKDSARLISLIGHRGPLDERNAAELLGFAMARFRAAITPLLMRGLVCQEIGKIRILNEDEGFVLNRIATYEAKLKAWTKAIDQAQRHLWFADETFVLMPALSQRIRSRLIPACSTAGVGVATLEDGVLSTIFEARQSSPSRTWLSWYLNELVFDIKCLDADAV